MCVLQMTFALFCMIIGIVFYGYIIASVAAGLANADAQRARYQERLDAIKSFLQVAITRPINWTSLNREVTLLQFFQTFTAAWSETGCKRTKYNKLRGRISSVGRTLDCRAGGRGFRPGPGQGANTQGLKITEKWRYFLCPENGQTFAWRGWPREMAVPSPVGDLKIVSPISAFVLNTQTII